MRAVVQRVRHACVRVAGEEIAAIGSGLLALVGVARDDDAGAAQQLAEKLVHLRVFSDRDGRMNDSLLDIGGELLVVSQFTLLGDTRKGRRPTYSAAAGPEHAEPLVEAAVAHARSLGAAVATGRFRATMEVELTNDGPVTLLVDTERSF